MDQKLQVTEDRFFGLNCHLIIKTQRFQANLKQKYKIAKVVKFVIAGYVRIACQIQDISHIIEAWKFPYTYNNFRQQLYLGLSGALLNSSLKNKKVHSKKISYIPTLQKNISYFGKQNFLASRLKNSIYFLKKRFSYISRNTTFQP